DFCSRCPLYGHGVAHTTEPKVMNVLHVEPVYLCQLSCPQCFTPKQRRQLKKPPYYMSVDFYRGLLEQLRREGVEFIRLVHFEGRGEPLLHQQLGEMVEITKSFFPEAFVMATSHGNFRYREWMHASGLDVLRLSVDGAFEESYRRYRVGGKLKAPLKLMREIQADRPNHPESRLRIEWKYILFEWNDSDEELERAGELADELGVRLRFCLTHTPGRSLRFEDSRQLEEVIERLVPGAGVETTFQLRSEPSEADSSHVLAEHAEALLIAALGRYRRGDEERAAELLSEALEADLGRKVDGESLSEEDLEAVADACRFPSTAAALANIALHLQRWRAAVALFRRYLELAPEAPDRLKIENAVLELAIGNQLGRHVDEAAQASPQDRQRAVVAAAEYDSGLPTILRRWPAALPWLRGTVGSSARPQTLLQLARLREAEGDLHTARFFLEAASSRGEALPARDVEMLAQAPENRVWESFVLYPLLGIVRRGAELLLAQGHGSSR
ncbi:MAG: radical SAM protein, partial [Acidobacteriota bacterium]